jgi:threonine dehydratase/serine racemase
MPTSASTIKRNAVLGYGATVVDCQPTLLARETTAAQVQADTGATLIHPYNHPHVIAGQGTAALELVQQVPNLDLIIAPVGGGGLISGTALVAAHIGIDVVGAEPTGADDAARSKAAGKLLPQTGPNTIADGLLTSLGELTWPIIRDLVATIVTVDDASTIEAMRFFWERTKLVIEPSSAVAVAAALSDEILGNDRWKRIGVIISGGNVDLSRLPWQD